MIFIDTETFGELVRKLGTEQNPYQPIVDSLEMTLDECRRTSYQFAVIPLDKGIGAISNSTYLATNLLEEALAEAKQWRDAFDYHVKGGHGGHRSDF